MGGGGKGGSQSQTTTVKPDPETMKMIQELFAYGKEVGKIPYQPWTGMDVAAFNPQQQGAMQGFSDIGNAFGLNLPEQNQQPPPHVDPTTGVTGYSSYPAYAQAMKNLYATQPEIAKRYAKFYEIGPGTLYNAPSIPNDPAVVQGIVDALPNVIEKNPTEERRKKKGGGGSSGGSWTSSQLSPVQQRNLERGR